MGCDIHMVLERKVGSKWIGINNFSGVAVSKYTMDEVAKLAEKAGAHFYVGNVTYPQAESRNYGRFAMLAGVRGDGPEPKGVPEDVSDLAAHEIENWGSDGHSHSWMPIDEAIQIFLATEGDPNELFLKEGDRRLKYPAEYFFSLYDEDLKKYEHRIVFWFDN